MDWFQIPIEFVRKLVILSLTLISHQHFSKRAVALEILSKIPENIQSQCKFLSARERECAIRQCVKDSNYRVRHAALEALIELAMNFYTLSFDTFPFVLEGLKDDYDVVRSASLDLIWLFSTIYPETLLKNEGHSLLNYCFIVICDSVNDVAKDNRRKAAELIGRFKNIDSSLLIQTVRKELLEPRQSANKSYTELLKDFHLFESSACGAIIHGLEDEFWDVRNATINSLRELALCCKEFALDSIEFVVDVFNDEIDKVRMNSVYSLHQICQKHNISLNDDHLEVILNILDDKTVSLRNCAQKLLCSFDFKSDASMLFLLDNLHKNLSKFPEDDMEIFLCFSEIGYRNPFFVLSNFDEIFHLDRRFLLMEEIPDNSICMASS